MNSINEKLYGYMETLTVFYPDGQIIYKVGEKYPLPWEYDSDGEALFFGNNLQINLVWSNITEDEKNFLHGLCQWIFIYRDPVYNIIFLGLGFSRKTIIVPVTSDEETVREWLNQDYKETLFLLYLIEATNKKILQMRNLGLQKDCVIALRRSLEGYHQPTPDNVIKCISNLETSDMFARAEFKWIYSEEQDEFVLITNEEGDS